VLVLRPNSSAHRQQPGSALGALGQGALVVCNHFDDVLRHFYVGHGHWDIAPFQCIHYSRGSSSGIQQTRGLVKHSSSMSFLFLSYSHIETDSETTGQALNQGLVILLGDFVLV
jgi:hypothetical protein